MSGSFPRLILAGHSHLEAISGRHLISERCEAVAAPRGNGTLIMVGPWPRDTTYWDTLADLGTGANVAILWEGNEHNMCYFFEAEAPFDFLSTHVATLNPTAHIISKAAIRQRFQEISVNELDVALTRLVSRGLNRIALVGTPPPKRDNEALRGVLRNEIFFVRLATALGQSVDTITITDPFVRLKLWYLLQDMRADEARKRGLMFIPVPTETQDADGFLKPEFWGPDVSHANEAYGDVLHDTLLRAFG